MQRPVSLTEPFSRRFIKCFRQHPAAYLMLLPAMVLTFVFAYIPMYGVVIGFKEYNAMRGILGSQWVGAKHFIDFFNNPYFLVLLRNTLSFSLYGFLTGFPLPIVLALLLNEVRHTRFKKTVQTISYMPYFISTVVVCGMLKSFLSYDGLFNVLGGVFGAKAVSFLSEPMYFQSICVWTGVWQGVGWNSIIYMAALSGIDQQLYEAARIDGCNRFGQAIHVTLPGIVPTIVILLILTMGSFISAPTGTILLLYTPLTYETADVFGTYNYRIGIRGGKFDYTAAIGLVSSVVSLMMILFFNWLSRKTTEQSLW